MFLCVPHIEEEGCANAILFSYVLLLLDAFSSECSPYSFVNHRGFFSALLSVPLKKLLFHNVADCDDTLSLPYCMVCNCSKGILFEEWCFVGIGVEDEVVNGDDEGDGAEEGYGEVGGEEEVGIGSPEEARKFPLFIQRVVCGVSSE